MCSILQPLKVSAFTIVRLSDKVKDFKDPQPEKALSPMEVTLLGIVIDEMFTQD